MTKLAVKKEKLEKAYWECGNAPEAYTKAGYDEGPGAYAAASRLLKSVKIQQRLQELREMEVTEIKIDKKFMTEKFLEIHKEAMEHNINVSKGALDSLVKLYGLNEAEKIDMTTKSDITVGGLAEVLKQKDKDELN